jgi:hypothetical protein
MLPEPRIMRAESLEGDMAERVGVEPTKPCSLLVFETSAINHSATSPRAQHDAQNRKTGVAPTSDHIDWWPMRESNPQRPP